MKTKNLTISLLTLGFAASAAVAGPDPGLIPMTTPAASGFENARRPISNPTLFDLALPRSEVHAFYMHHRFPDMINLAGGGQVPFGGDANIVAVQLEYALTERFSIVATKDGYIDFNPDAVFTSDEGFANLAAGVKYTFLYDPARQSILSGIATIELPTGDDGVFQGEGDGAVNLILSQLKLINEWQFASAAGLQVPFDDAFSTQGFLSVHASYETCPWFIPLVELNWFHILDEGDGAARFPNQVGGGVPSVATFEGADLINWGASNSGDNDYVTLALGFRSRLSESVDIGFAYEFPLTDEEDNITDDRFTFDLVWNF